MPPSPQPVISPNTRLGAVHLNVHDLDTQIAFYTQVLGMTLHTREGGDAALGAPDEVLLRLSEDRAARRVDRAAGMYHFALLYPSMKELARAVARLFALKYPNAPTDHGMSKTTYLEDPEDNTIELYVRSLDDAVMDYRADGLVVRYADGRVGNGRDPLDVRRLFSHLSPDDRLDTPMPAGTRIGHVHLYGVNLQTMMAFYRDVMGFSEGPMSANFRMADVGLDAAQNHVVAFNTWKGPNLAPARAGALGMRHFTVIPADGAERARLLERLRAAGVAQREDAHGVWVKDPSGIAIRIA